MYIGVNPPPTMYGPLSYDDHTVTVLATSAIILAQINITHSGTPTV